jgi:hypothetical protein
VNVPGSTFGPLYAPTNPRFAVAPAAITPSLVTRTFVPVCSQVALQPLLTLCHVVGQVKASVQPLTGPAALFVMSTDPTNPLPQSLVSRSFTVQLAPAGAAVVKVSGSDDQEARPALSRATTLTVYRRPGSRLRTVNDVPLVSPSCPPPCRYTSYLATDPATAGHEIVAVRSVIVPAAGRPGAFGAPAWLLAGRRVTSASEYAGTVWEVAEPAEPDTIASAPLVNVCTAGTPPAGVQPW